MTGCSGDLSTLDPAGPSAKAIADLWWVMLAGAGVIFASVMALFLLTLWRPHRARILSSRGWIVAGGLVMPLPILAVLLAVALVQGETMLQRTGDDGEVLRIEARSRMWEWEFFYPETAGASSAMPRSTLGILHIPAGRVIEIVATSEDVIHSFWVPRLGGKIDAIPGHAATLRILADRPGRYGGICAEYCGTGHASMSFVVEAHDPSAFEPAIRQLASRPGGEGP
ncbi:cytochrome c oxidase subunit 2 [Rhodoligotrophos appendicifer]|uniref:cytochrome c oxidase subunit II n=1 Tax=Rhodoligotrophos appendicifer TaxID=987056 RepID=UPI001FE6D7CB|nr:cytochrome c oxidase subunit II [Rhodoligotrophos appendicifer]